MNIELNNRKNTLTAITVKKNLVNSSTSLGIDDDDFWWIYVPKADRAVRYPWFLELQRGHQEKESKWWMSHGSKGSFCRHNEFLRKKHLGKGREKLFYVKLIDLAKWSVGIIQFFLFFTSSFRSYRRGCEQVWLAIGLEYIAEKSIDSKEVLTSRTSESRAIWRVE